jgi:capsid protein
MRRSGFTLVEAVGVVSAIGMLLTLSVALLNQTLAAHRAALSHLQRVHSLEQWVERLRDDVHAATQVAQGVELLIKQADNRAITYAFAERSVVRTRRQAGEIIGQDRWQLPSPCTATWQIEDQGRVPLLVVKLVFGEALGDFEDIQIAARVGSGGAP